MGCGGWSLWKGGSSTPRCLVCHNYTTVTLTTPACFVDPQQVVGDRPGVADAASEEYVSLLLRELAASVSPKPLAGAVDVDQGWSTQIDAARIREAGGLTSIFFGGGTPSLTPPHLVQKVIAALEAAFGLNPDAEVRVRVTNKNCLPARHRPCVPVCPSHSPTHPHLTHPKSQIHE